MPVPGFNPIRWDCEQQGCFNKLCRPKLEIFAECFPGKMAMSDIDGIVEIGGRYLMLEWKNEWDGKVIHVDTARRIMYERVTADGDFVVYVVAGNAQTMEVWASSKFEHGKRQPTVQESLCSLKVKFMAWAHMVRSV